MLKAFENLHPIFFLIGASALDVTGDAVVRIAIHDQANLYRAGLFLLGAALLLGYGTFLNLAPLEFGQVVGLYIATLFVMWQIINLIFFKTLPTTPILVGGALIRRWHAAVPSLSPSDWRELALEMREGPSIGYYPADNQPRLF